MVIQLSRPSLRNVRDPCGAIRISAPGTPSIVSPAAGDTLKRGPPSSSATMTSWPPEVHGHRSGRAHRESPYDLGEQLHEPGRPAVATQDHIRQREGLCADVR